MTTQTTPDGLPPVVVELLADAALAKADAALIARAAADAAWVITRAGDQNVERGLFWAAALEYRTAAALYREAMRHAAGRGVDGPEKTKLVVFYATSAAAAEAKTRLFADRA